MWGLGQWLRVEGASARPSLHTSRFVYVPCPSLPAPPHRHPLSSSSSLLSPSQVFRTHLAADQEEVALQLFNLGMGFSQDQCIAAARMYGHVEPATNWLLDQA